MKRIILLLLATFIVFSLCGCNESGTKLDDNKNETVSKTDTEQVPESEFVGTWICLRENSCNNMEIVLTITQENGNLNIVRDMESGKSSGSKITFTVDIPTGDSFKSSNTNGIYKLSNGILTESFEGGKVNYYSSTGNLDIKICKFPFCSDECGDLGYCTKHDSEIERYESLYDSQKKSIGYFIKGRYDYYDKQNGGYAGDKYSDTIMREAADKYGLTVEHLNIIWMKFYEY